jgi:hypothetical protein
MRMQMPLKEHFNPFSKLQKRGEFPHFRQYSWWPFGKQKARTAVSRPGALKPEQLKKIVQEMGTGSVVEILRIGYDGTIDDLPMLLKITQISDEYFSGKIVNVEKQMIEEGTEKLIFAKKGGGTIEFNYDDGDIKEITKSIDQSVVSESRDVSAQKEILAALEIGDKIMMAYYDENQHGSVNVEGTLLSKSPENNKFKIMIEKVNRIEIEKKVEREFDVDKDLVIDIDMV